MFIGLSSISLIIGIKFTRFSRLVSVFLCRCVYRLSIGFQMVSLLKFLFRHFRVKQCFQLIFWAVLARQWEFHTCNTQLVWERRECVAGKSKCIVTQFLWIKWFYQGCFSTTLWISKYHFVDCNLIFCLKTHQQKQEFALRYWKIHQGNFRPILSRKCYH